MNGPLEQLLRDADRTAQSATRPASLEAIYEQARWRRTRRNVMRTVAVFAIVGASSLWMLRSHKSTPVVDALPHSTPEPTLAALNAEVARREALVSTLLKIEKETHEQIARHRREAEPDPADEANQELENAAFAMVYQANRIAQTAGNAPAQNVYREVVAYFPDTPSAEVARERLIR